jgi:ABC-type lipoprotein export system ATPase subunit
MSEAGALLELEEVSKSFPGPEGGKDVVVLHDLSLRVTPGEAVAIVGPSGSGKSTLLNIVGALDLPTKGVVRLDGQDIRSMSEAELARIRNRQIGFIFQLHHLLPQCSVLENVLVPALVNGDAAADETRERAKKLLDRVGLAERMHHRPAQISGGERQRTAVVRALINKPKLVLADEPTGQLDGKSADALADLLVQLNEEEGVALLVVTHAHDLAERMGRTLRLSEGTLQQQEVTS